MTFTRFDVGDYLKTDADVAAYQAASAEADAMTDPTIAAGQTWIVPRAPRIVVVGITDGVVAYHAEGHPDAVYQRNLVDFTAWVVRMRAALAG